MSTEQFRLWWMCLEFLIKIAKMHSRFSLIRLAHFVCTMPLRHRNYTRYLWMAHFLRRPNVVAAACASMIYNRMYLRSAARIGDCDPTIIAFGQGVSAPLRKLTPPSATTVVLCAYYYGIECAARFSVWARFRFWALLCGDMRHDYGLWNLYL